MLPKVSSVQSEFSLLFDLSSFPLWDLLASSVLHFLNPGCDQPCRGQLAPSGVGRVLRRSLKQVSAFWSVGREEAQSGALLCQTPNSQAERKRAGKQAHRDLLVHTCVLSLFGQGISWVHTPELLGQQKGQLLSLGRKLGACTEHRIT